MRDCFLNENLSLTDYELAVTQSQSQSNEI